MGYVEKCLMEGEHIVYEATYHYVIYWLPALLALVGLLLLFFPIGEMAFTTRLVFALVIVGVAGIWTLAKWGGKRFVLTNKRIIEKVGIIRLDSNELVLHRCEGVNLSQGILGRILNYGTVIVTTGEVANEYPYIKNPLKFKTLVNQQIDNYKELLMKN